MMVNTRIGPWIAVLLLAPAAAGQDPRAPAAQSAVVAAPAAAPADTARHFETKIAAYVNRDIITEAEVWKRVRVNEQSLAGLSEEKRKVAFERNLLEMISDAVVRQGKERLQLSIPEHALRAMIEEKKEALGSEGFQTSLSERGFTTEREFADRYRQETESWIYVQTQTGRLKSLGIGLRAEHVIEPTAREIREWYQAHLEKEFQSQTEVKVRIINLSFTKHGGLGAQGTTPEQADARTLEFARRIKADLATGADFATLAGLHSSLYEKVGGDAGWIHKDSEGLVPELIAIALEQQAGTVSEPIQLRRSYALLFVEERKEARTVPFEEAQAGIRQQLKDAAIARASVAVELKLIKEAWIAPRRYQTILLAQREAELRGQ